MKPFRTLDRFIIKELLGPFLFGVMAFTLIMVAGGLLFKLADLIIEKGVSLSVAGRLFLYELPSVVVLTLPMSCLLSTLLGFSKMSSNSEIVALKAAGIPFSRICRPVLFAAVVVTFVAFAINETLVPMGKVASEKVMRYEVAKEKPALLKQQVFLRSGDKSPEGLRRIIYINKLNSTIGHMQDVVVQEFKGSTLVRLTTAETGDWKDGVWYLNDGDVFEVKKKNTIEFTMHFKQQALPIALTPQQVSRSDTKPDDMSCRELLEQVNVLDAQGKDVDHLWMAFHLRLAIPWACLILALIGSALGVRPMRNGGASVGFGQSILIVFVYYVVMSMARSLGQTGRMPPILAAWMSNILFFAGAMLLSRRADR